MKSDAERDTLGVVKLTARDSSRSDDVFCLRCNTNYQECGCDIAITARIMDTFLTNCDRWDRNVYRISDSWVDTNCQNCVFQYSTSCKPLIEYIHTCMSDLTVGPEEMEPIQICADYEPEMVYGY